MTEKQPCQKKPEPCQHPRCDCFKDEGQKRTEELAKKRPFLLRMKTITR